MRANLTHNSRRGLGYTACKAYGLVPIPQLPESHFQMVGWLLARHSALHALPRRRFH